MTVAFLFRRGTRTVVRGDTPARAAAGLCLLAGLAGIVSGCGGGGTIAPVRSPIESAVPGRGNEHVVGRGDTLYSIAWRFGLDYRVLAEVNSIRDPYTINSGQRLVIPEPGDSVPPAPEPSTVRSEPAESGGASTQDGASSTQGDASTQGIAVSESPVVAPLSPSSADSAQSTGPPREPLVQPEQPAPPAPEPVSHAASEPASVSRTVAGVRWTRPTAGKTAEGFGRGGNKGIDIEGSFEQPIRAVAGGRVVYSGSGLIGYGKLVIVKHNNRLLSAYAYNERLHVGEGDDVKIGQHIADMGRSAKGRVMLHFEIRRDGKPVDPLRFLP